MRVVLIELYNNLNYEVEDYFFDVKKQNFTKNIPEINIQNVDNKLVSKINYSLHSFLYKNKNFQLVNKLLIERKFSKTGIFQTKIIEQIA